MVSSKESEVRIGGRAGLNDEFGVGGIGDEGAGVVLGEPSWRRERAEFNFGSAEEERDDLLGLMEDSASDSLSESALPV